MGVFRGVGVFREGDVTSEPLLLQWVLLPKASALPGSVRADLEEVRTARTGQGEQPVTFREDEWGCVVNRE